MDHLTVLLDAPVNVELRKTPLAKFDRYWDPRYGRFAITREMADSWRKNLAEVFGGEVSIDLDHSPEKKGTTEAAGWVKGLRAEGDHVVADVEWTPLGEAAIREKRYRYLSPTFTANYKDEYGNAHGQTLVGVALTNRPVLRKGVPALSLSLDPLFAETTAGLDDTDLSDQDTAFLDRFDDAVALENWVSKHGGLPVPIHELVKDLKDSGHDESKAVAIAVSQAKKNCARGTKGKYDWCAAVAKWEAMKAATMDSAAPSDSRRAMEITAKILSALGLDDQADEQKVLDAVAGLKGREKLAEALELDKDADDTKLLDAIVELKRPPVEDGTVKLSQDQHAELVEKANKGETAHTELATMRFDKAFDDAVRKGKAAPAMRDHFAEVFKLDEERAVKMLDEAPEVVPTAARGKTGESGEAPEGVDPDRHQLDQKVKAYMVEHKVDYMTALDKLEQAETVAA